MSHELRTPMNAVISTGTLLQHTPLNPQQRDYVDRLETASSHMLNLINDVLDLARLESPQQVLEQQPFTLGELLANLDKLLQEHAQQKHLALNLQSWFPPHTALLGDADPPVTGVVKPVEQCPQIHRTGACWPVYPGNHAAEPTQSHAAF